MPKKETITIEKDKLQTLLSKLEYLEKKVEELSKPKEVHTTSSSKPVLHTLTAIRQIQQLKEIEEREKVEEMLNKAADYAIAEYKMNPPRHRK